MIVSSHDPQDADVKRHPFAEAADGAIGLETLLAAALRLHHNGEIGLMPLLRAMTINPARLLGLPSGRLEKGAPADLILVDLGQPWVVDKAQLRARSKNSPFDESKMQGRVLTTMVAGNTRLPIRCRRARLTRSQAPSAVAMGLLFSVYAPLALLVGYLLGSIPFGLLLTARRASATCASIGSGNIGATNVLRTGHKGLAAATLLLDMLKGTVAVLLVVRDRQALRGLRRLPARLRRRPRRLPRPHLFPVWLRFDGGKGVATYIGVLLGAHWPAARRVLPGVGCGGRGDALFLAGGAGGTVAVVLYYLLLGQAGLLFILIMSRPDLRQAPRQHPPPARRRGEQDWRPRS